MTGAGLIASGVSTSAAAAPDTLRRELAEVRSATAAYNDPENAYADDYVVYDRDRNVIPLDEVVEKGHFVCGMGFHFANFDRFGSTDRTEPAVLVYGVDDDDELILGAVEYLVPKRDEYEDAPPDLFDHDGGDEQWSEFGPGWALHVWVHTHNPDGVFNPTNPRTQFCADG